MNSVKQWHFEALDTWFFRESRPYGVVGGSELTSLFPPPARTVAGAIRTLIGENAQINWQDYKNGKAQYYKQLNLLQEIGTGPDDFGKLRLSGPFILYKGQRLYPMPQSLMKVQIENRLYVLKPGSPVHCDLGENVRLPFLAQAGAKPLENAWLTEAGLLAFLGGKLPESNTIIYQNELFENEPRLGIARDNAKRITQEHKLYQTQHIRPTAEVKVGALISGINHTLHPKMGQVRFGGEGRLAGVEITDVQPQHFQLPGNTEGHNLLLMLLTPADLGCQKNSWLPSSDFEQKTDKNSHTVWEGTLNGIELTVISAVLGKSVREGGWDLQNEEPRSVKSLVPAGSVWFCQVKKNLSSAIKKLQGFQIGEETVLGRGELAVGIWK
jgi:CRISPR-associated protein Cmr3